MTHAAEVAALREAAGFSRLEHVVPLRVAGTAAFDLLSRLSSRRLFLREGQLSHTLFLREDAGIFADAYVGSGEDGAFYVLSEGPGQAELCSHMESVKAAGEDVVIEPLRESCELWSIDGPYAWELAAAVLGPVVLGMPYLTLLHFDDGICFRTGKTGEYGYSLLVEREAAERTQEQLMREGATLGVQTVSVAALDECALENWHFCIRTLRETRFANPLTPLELQLQWRVSRDHSHLGHEALAARRAQGPEVRATCFCADEPVAPGQNIYLGDQLVGEVLAAGFSHTARLWVGNALLALPVAHPGIARMCVRAPERLVQIRTVTPPLVNNRSLHVDPHRHSYRTRELDEFPALAVAV